MGHVLGQNVYRCPLCLSFWLVSLHINRRRSRKPQVFIGNYTSQKYTSKAVLNCWKWSANLLHIPERSLSACCKGRPRIEISALVHICFRHYAVVSSTHYLAPAGRQVPSSGRTSSDEMFSALLRVSMFVLQPALPVTQHLLSLVSCLSLPSQEALPLHLPQPTLLTMLDAEIWQGGNLRHKRRGRSDL